MGKGKVYRDLFADRKETNINITVILKRVKKIMPNGKNNGNLILKIKKCCSVVIIGALYMKF